jgi:NAD(P)-dependent dehydrogenase (short-subunit alcohol dehydrogenase family)
MDTQPLCTIVGMGRGISYSVARRFAAEGFRIGMIARDAALLKEVEAELPQSRGVAADAGDEAALRSALRQLGAPEVLVYNASAGHTATPSELAIEDAVADFRVNALGAVVAVQESVAAMRAAAKGTILLTGGGLALGPMAQVASLSMGKAAIRNLAFSLAEELAPAGIHVATVTVCGFVQPGTPFDPDLIAAVYWDLHQQSQEQFEREVIYR